MFFKEKYEFFGLSFSILSHGFIVLLFIFVPDLWQHEIIEPVVYSITIEGGKSLGGKDQLSNSDKKSAVAPPKTVQDKPQQNSLNEKHEEKKAEEKIIEEKKPEEKTKEQEKQKEEKLKEEKIDENIINEGKKPTPVPTQSKPTIVPTPINTPKPTTKPEPTLKPTILPTKRPENKDSSEKEKNAETEKSENKINKNKEIKKTEPKEDVNKELQKAMQRYLGNSVNAGGQGFGAAKTGGNDMGGGIVKPREFFIYMSLLKDKVKSGWRWPYNDGLIATIEFYISPQGVISSPKIIKSSGNSQFDDSVIRSVLQANPLPPPPPTVYNDFRQVNMIFDPRD